jgi:C-terminal processing protease CtpA/Prc
LLENPEKVRKQKKDWRLANYEKNKLQDKLRGEKYRRTEKYKQTQANYKARNAEMFKRLNDKHSRARVDELHLSYVKQLMVCKSSMSSHEIPDSLALAYKELIKINRYLKEITK